MTHTKGTAVRMSRRSPSARLRADEEFQHQPTYKIEIAILENVNKNFVFKTKKITVFCLFVCCRHTLRDAAYLKMNVLGSLRILRSLTNMQMSVPLPRTPARKMQPNTTGTK